MAKIGLVAGFGTLPITFARNAKAQGETVIGFGIKGVTDEGVAACVDKMHWLTWGSLQKAILFATMDGVRQVVLLGKITKSVVFEKQEALDPSAQKVLGKVGDKKDYALLKGVEGLLKKIGIAIIDPTPYLQELIPQSGVLTGRAPTAQEEGDIAYGKDVARVAAGFDVGQTVVVKDKTVIAIEAVEGTDETLKRAGKLVHNGCVVVKMARPEQDMRFDVPLVGIDTLKNLIAAKGTALALEAGKTYLSDRAELIELADANGIAIVAV